MGKHSIIGNQQKPLSVNVKTAYRVQIFSGQIFHIVHNCLMLRIRYRSYTTCRFMKHVVFKLLVCQHFSLISYDIFSLVNFFFRLFCRSSIDCYLTAFQYFFYFTSGSDAKLSQKFVQSHVKTSFRKNTRRDKD